MFAFIVRRLLISIPVLLLASFIVFCLVAFAGDPLARYRIHNPPYPQSFFIQKRHELHLDKSIPWRYGHWLWGVLHANFGRDNNGIPVLPQLQTRLFVTFRMVILSIIIAFILAVVVGVYSAVKQYSLGDYAATFLGFLFLSMPVFWLAALMKEILAVKLNTWLGGQYVYTIGECTPNLGGHHCWYQHFGNWAGHIVLPTIALAVISFAGWSRYQRASMLDVLNSDYVRLARAKGLTNRRVMVRHALRTALIPIVTVVAIDFTTVVAGAVITETVFSWEGMGRFLIQGIQNNDVNDVLAWMLVVSVIVVLFNMIADILYAFLDPRIRYA